jgi:hypothetical protein
LKDRSYSCKRKSNGLPRLRTLYVYCQRGLLSHEGLPLRELKLYATQRALPTTLGRKNTITELKTQLEQADDDVTFCLLDLPPELRKIIFSYYFNYFHAPISEHSHFPTLKCQPPITRVSRAIRQVSVPLFYGCWGFVVDIPAAHLRHNPSYLTYGTQRLLNVTTTEQFGWIRNIRVNLRMAKIDVKLSIDICNKRTPVEVSCFIHAHWPTLEAEPFPLPRECLDHLSSELNASVRTIAAREAACKLRKGDLDKL